MYKRILDASTLSGKSSFLWGLRQTCRSTLLRKLVPESPYYDLLEAGLFRRLTAAPGLIEEELLATGHSHDHGPVIIDEVKSRDNPTSDQLRGLRSWKGDHPGNRCILVSRASQKRQTTDHIDILP